MPTPTLAALAASLSLTVALAGCSDPAPSATATTTRPPQAAQSTDTDVATGGGDTQPSTNLPTQAPRDSSARPDPEREQLRQLYLADPPTGTGPEIALRFLQALQDGRDLAAAHELYIFGRSLLAGHDMDVLHGVMRDIAHNARLADAGPCTTATAVAAEVAVVSCGQRRVVVHVLADRYSSGVQISDVHPRHDVYPGPHTHAYTSIEL